MNEFDSYTELALSKNRSEDVIRLQLAFLDRQILWQKAKELNMSVSDMRKCEAASSHYEEDKKAAAAAEKKAAAEKVAAEKAAKAALAQKEREAIRPLAELLENGLVEVEGECFAIGKYPVTQKLWSFVMGSNPSRFKDPELPVETVSYGDCMNFITKLNEHPVISKSHWRFRLPSSKEWKACCIVTKANGRTATKGNGPIAKKCCTKTNPTNRPNGWLWGNSNRETHRVGQLEANVLGVCDMIGNVSEWVSDGKEMERFCLGGNFLTEILDDTEWDRDLFPQDTRACFIGFRLCGFER